MKKAVAFLDYITTKGSVRHTQIWLTTAFLLTIYAAYITWEASQDTLANVVVFCITALLGYASVVSLAFRRPLSGNLFGITANMGEMYSQFQFRNIGLVFS